MDGVPFLGHTAEDNIFFCLSDSFASGVFFSNETGDLYDKSVSQLLGKNPEKRNFIYVLCIKFFLNSGTEVIIQ